MIQVPHEFLFDECLRTGFSLPAYGDYGVGQLFLPKRSGKRRVPRNHLSYGREIGPRDFGI